MKKIKIKSKRQVTIHVSFSIMLIWLVCMLLLTIITANLMFSRFMDERRDFHSFTFERVSFYDELNPDTEVDLNSAMIDVIKDTNRYDIYLNDINTKLIEDKTIATSTAVIFYDREGNLVQESSNIIDFYYVDEETWINEKQPFKFGEHGFLKIEDEHKLIFENLFFEGVYNMSNMFKIKGIMKGDEIEPVEISYINRHQINEILDTMEPSEHTVEYENGKVVDMLNPSEDTIEYKNIQIVQESIGYEYEISDFDKDGLLKWIEVEEISNEKLNDENLVTIYAQNTNLSLYKERNINYRDNEYKNLVDVIKPINFHGDSGYYEIALDQSESNFNQILSINARGITISNAMDKEIEPELIMVTAIEIKPLYETIRLLEKTYKITFYLSIYLIAFLSKKIYKHTIKPVEHINKAIENNWENIYLSQKDDKLWEESDKLYDNYILAYHNRIDYKNEISRLSTALDYSKRAEEKRRILTSNIAHELKTPLSIINSYSQGLKEKIAEDKKDKYLEIIIGETEKMDNMVLQMLDLSRLESGRVKLSINEFSIIEITQEILNRFELLIEDKKLQINFSYKEDLLMLADESRIFQVIENLLSNAIKYTSENGYINIKISRIRSKIKFEVENQHEKLSQKDLSEIWDAFYRVDKSRNTEGTGLGLSIVKNIVELHGGTCSIENTENGVKVSFMI